jgi:hypothetical protein
MTAGTGSPETLETTTMRENKEANRTDARATLAALDIPIGADFHALNRSQVDALLFEAKRARYRRPQNANGSKARYYHDRLQRLARIMVVGLSLALTVGCAQVEPREPRTVLESIDAIIETIGESTESER